MTKPKSIDRIDWKEIFLESKKIFKEKKNFKIYSLRIEFERTIYILQFHAINDLLNIGTSILNIELFKKGLLFLLTNINIKIAKVR